MMTDATDKLMPRCPHRFLKKGLGLCRAVSETCRETCREAARTRWLQQSRTRWPSQRPLLCPQRHQVQAVAVRQPVVREDIFYSLCSGIMNCFESALEFFHLLISHNRDALSAAKGLVCGLAMSPAQCIGCVNAEPRGRNRRCHHLCGICIIYGTLTEC